MPSEAFIAEVFADIERLTSRDYSEVGVPMFLVAEDLSRAEPALPSPPSAHQGATIAAAFEDVLAAIRSRKPELTSVDISRALEVVADRYTLAMAMPSFSRATIRGAGEGEGA